ncbi:hypothetical protein RHGRI_025320 [Rhododendron griersonianum]|uniref:Protein NEOXANTHIN-DEFICIENT 1 n=1 Tax=Rhododendron griersonianum TaxID=479676 RepID=A0AAV6IR11_9ERIC|nr:hypothetical protein RHGRI_025320 [Rhododendron griersonianum]
MVVIFILSVLTKGSFNMNSNPPVDVGYVNNSFPYNSAGSFINFFQGLAYEHVNFIFSDALHVQSQLADLHAAETLRSFTSSAILAVCGRSSNNLNWDSPKDAIVFYSFLLEDLVLWRLKKQNLLRGMANLHGNSKEGKSFSCLFFITQGLHLVKSETARAFIPKEFKLVEAFGYTLGGFFLASYDDSPAGIFDELVVIAGIVWNPPTSCAWAARVLVNSDEACVHGRKVGSSLMDVGLPSQVARFSKQRITPIARQSENNSNRFLRMIGVGTVLSHPKNCLDIQVTEINGTSATDICTINVGTAALAKAVPELNSNKLIGPVIKMSLPSFRYGRTEYNPHLLKYSCQIECWIRAVRPAKVSVPSVAPKSATEQSPETPSSKFVDSIISRDLVQNERNLSISVLLSKPILALEFNCLKMQVEAPTIVCPCSEYTFRAV